MPKPSPWLAPEERIVSRDVRFSLHFDVSGIFPWLAIREPAAQAGSLRFMMNARIIAFGDAAIALA